MRGRFATVILSAVLFVSVGVVHSQEATVQPPGVNIQAINPTDTPTPTLTGTPPTATPTDESVAPTTPLPTATPRPDVPDFVFDWSEEAIFPMAVRFQLAIERPVQQIADISLTIFPPEQPQRDIPFSLRNDAITGVEGFTRYDLIWNVPENNPLPYDSVIRYEWFIVMEGGATATVPGVFPFDHPGDLPQWAINEDPDQRLSLIYPEDRVNPEMLREQTNDIYDLLAVNLGRELQYRLVLISPNIPFDPCVPNDEGDPVVIGPRSGLVLPCNRDVIGGIFRQLGYDVFPVESLSQNLLIEDLQRHMIETFYAPIWADYELPAWFRSGLVDFYTPQDKFGFLERVQNATRSGQLYTLNQMNTPNDTDLLWKAQAYTLVLYIADQAGISSVFSMANPVRIPGNAGTPTAIEFETIYQNLTGQQLQALIPSVEIWAFSSSAESGAHLNIYAGPTEQPTSTNTNTPFPPTPSDTATATATETVTATSTGEKSATPLPTLTPTVTRTPAPPSVTPLPARSFSELTPEGTQTGQSTTSNDETPPELIAGVIAVFALLAALIGIALLRTRR